MCARVERMVAPGQKSQASTPADRRVIDNAEPRAGGQSRGGTAADERHCCRILPYPAAIGEAGWEG
jgi:hypothetical protein